jgi:lipoprotein-releasing system permease protein
MIFNAVERLMALRYLRARREEGFISVIAAFSLLGIALGVATLIIVMAVMNGFREELMGRILGINGHLTIYSTGDGITDYEAAADKLRALDGVVGVVPQIQAQVIVTAGNQALGAVVRGMTAESLRGRALVADNVLAGSLDDYGAKGGVLVGSRLAGRLNLGPGEGITLLSPRGETTVLGSVPRIKTYDIAGLFQIGMYEYDSSFIYMPLAQAQIFFKLPNRANAIEIYVADPDKVWLLRSEIGRVLGPGFRSVDWQQANSSFFNAVKVERNVMFLILSLIILVAAFNILSGQ